ncbi:MAG: nucleotidyl transferase AbiEii/AbiGii toxin family protein [Syntrophales bacterium LBB04]|nr:nucleotidyl transferase AbiEii/AbiGii toxin family protein [Syntrophales bacterium LBB04]
MIPKADIVAWRRFAPWINDAQVEQDLIISRALVAIFNSPFLAERLAFRGGTALHKLYVDRARRYSEDIDLVQIIPAPIGQVIDALQELLNGFLGAPRRKQTEQSAILTYRMESEGPPLVQMRLKVEINTREHFAVEGYQKQPFTVQSRWFKGDCEITTYTLEELLATKLRALYQRRKGRDLFDLWLGITAGKADADRIIHAFKQYMENEGQTVETMLYEKNLQEKLRHRGFLSDLNPLLPADAIYDVKEAYHFVRAEIIDKLDRLS